MLKSILFVVVFAAALLGSFFLPEGGARFAQGSERRMEEMKPVKTETATLGGGCFWCLEAIFQRVPGVKKVTSGFAGGTIANPTYEQVCTGMTGHAEVVQIEFDPSVLTYSQLLNTFWECHDPTTLDRQGADVGTQYRSVIFYGDESQKLTAEKSKAEAQKEFNDQIVTEIQPLKAFYTAEAYHQDYYNNHSNAPYCTFVIRPKLNKLHMK